MIKKKTASINVNGLYFIFNFNEINNADYILVSLAIIFVCNLKIELYDSKIFV